ncbi:MAG: hypothetical protein MK135_11685, partial [Polyangiaceae bacterium]|nr:hypothetical protein [Polyangiaceae bacterium]
YSETEFELPSLEEELGEPNRVDLNSLQNVSELNYYIQNSYFGSLVFPALTEVNCLLQLDVFDTGMEEVSFPVLSDVGQGECDSELGGFNYYGFGDILHSISMPLLEATSVFSLNSQSQIESLAIGAGLNNTTLTPDEFSLEAHVTSLDISNIDSVGSDIYYCLNQPSIPFPIDSIDNGGGFGNGPGTGGENFPPITGFGGAGGGPGGEDPFFCSEYDRLADASLSANLFSCNCDGAEQPL